MRQFTGGNRPVKHKVMVGTGFLNYFAGESKGIGGREKRPLAVQSNAHRSTNLLKPADLTVDVVDSVGRLDVLVVKATIEHYMTVSDHFPGVGVVVHRICIQNVVAI